MNKKNRENDIFTAPFRADHGLTLENPFIVSFCKDTPQRDHLSSDIHYSLQICLVLSGTFEIVYPEYRSEIGKGQLCWTFCWEPHATRPSSEKNSMLVISILLDALGNIDSFKELNWLEPFFLKPEERPCPVEKKDREKVIEIAEDIIEYDKSRTASSKTMQWIKIHELICYVSDNCQSPERGKNKLKHQPEFTRIVPAIKLIYTKMPELITLEEAAAACALSRSRFSRIFTDAIGDSFGRYALRSRLSGAVADLKNSGYTLKDIASRWGFTDESHFSRAFKKQFMLTPAAYRKKNQ